MRHSNTDTIKWQSIEYELGYNPEKYEEWNYYAAKDLEKNDEYGNLEIHSIHKE